MAERVTSAEELLRRYAAGERAFQVDGPHGANLRGADLSGAILCEADLAYADLTEANLSGANLHGALLVGAHLSEADLNGANLTRADLGLANMAKANMADANLRGANLNGAQLPEADLPNANLSGATLRRANVSQAILYGANLSGANLSNADLTCTNLFRANLSEANLTKASIGGSAVGATVLTGVNLAGVDTDSLTLILHRGPSYVDHSTLREFAGRIPEKFLRGCGLPDWEIELAKLHDPDLSAAQTSEILRRAHELRHGGGDYYSTFISYSHTDKEFATRLHDALQAKGIRCWLDERQLLPGDDVREQIDRGIRLWDKVILCASEDSLTSGWVDAELDRAFQKEAKLMKERGGRKPLALIPLDLDRYLFDGWKSAKRADMIARYVADFRDWRDNFDAKLEPLIKALRADDLGREPAPSQRL